MTKVIGKNNIVDECTLLTVSSLAINELSMALHTAQQHAFWRKPTERRKKRSRLLQVINHCDDITEAFIMSCSHRCQAWVEPSRGNHLTCGRKISGSLKTCISHCKQYFTTIRTLKYLRLSHGPEPLPLCCRALIYHFHYFQVYSQPVFSFYFFIYPESN